MKKNDIAVIILIAAVSAMIAWFTANALIGEPKQDARKVETAERISSTVESPDKKVFNEQAINPTVDRSIGKSANKLPFESLEE